MNSRTARKGVRRIALSLLALVVTSVLVVRSQTPYTTTDIFNAVYNSATQSLMGVPWGGTPGTGLSVNAILTAVFVEETVDSEAYLRIRETIRGTALPSTCVASDALFINTTTGIDYVCNSTGDGWISAAGGGGGGDGATTLFELEDVNSTPAAAQDVLTWVVDGAEEYAQFLPPQATVIADLAITTAKLNDLAVTTGKVADGAITSAKLANTTCPPGTYGSTTQSVQVTFDADGRCTAISNQEISGIPTGSVGPAELQSTAVTPGVCGSATEVCVVTTDQDGRITNQTEVAIVASGVPDALVAESLKLTPVVETTTCDMSFSTHKLTPTGTTTCTLPAAASATVGTYNFYIMNGNNLVVARTGADLINGTAGNLAAIQGPLTHVQCALIDTTLNWQCSVTGFAGYGTPTTTLCSVVAGGTNTSTSGSGSYIPHSLSCQVDANKLTTGSRLKICSGWEWTTGTGPPALSVQWLSGPTSAVILNQNPGATGIAPGVSVTRNAEFCLTTLVTAAPGPAVATENIIQAVISESPTATIAGNGGVDQPVTLATNGNLIFKQASRWSAAGTQAASVTQKYMYIEGSGLLP